MGGLRASKMTRKQKLLLSRDYHINPDEYLWVTETPDYIILERKDNHEREYINRCTGEKEGGYAYAG